MDTTFVLWQIECNYISPPDLYDSMLLYCVLWMHVRFDRSAFETIIFHSQNWTILILKFLLIIVTVEWWVVNGMKSCKLSIFTIRCAFHTFKNKKFRHIKVSKLWQEDYQENQQSTVLFATKQYVHPNLSSKVALYDCLIAKSCISCELHLRAPKRHDKLLRRQSCQKLLIWIGSKLDLT